MRAHIDYQTIFDNDNPIISQLSEELLKYMNGRRHATIGILFQ